MLKWRHAGAGDIETLASIHLGPRGARDNIAIMYNGNDVIMASLVALRMAPPRQSGGSAADSKGPNHSLGCEIWVEITKPFFVHRSVSPDSRCIFNVFLFSTRCWQQIHQKMRPAAGCRIGGGRSALSRRLEMAGVGGRRRLPAVL